MFTANLKYHSKTSFLIFGRRNIMFIWVSHFYVLDQSQNWTLSWSSSPNHISYSDIPSFHPIPFSIWSVLSTCHGHHRIGGAEHFVEGDSWADLSACCHSNPLCLLPLLLCRWCNAPHVHFSPICLGITIAWRIAAIQGGISDFVGADVGE